ncbi:uncharacterized protein B0J16DRAFT_184543 [Fusarium flagelliforme]|uniref:Uncharacterized protein n=1 Tax=Fusarium flagelliforme TaxID=2675880 RepID=A0A395M839_9HYPO|nr:uncharacterized protein B0J16DRAFT_184543 [Fusarium flagelliforme]KAH7174733.1 hypothetical protein B0J16DRAFT_184543 [Fusarium flagelliforme]RFN44034.1 hypothetical protein FIE12Z_11739 [Fusarium flagelliforme]
MGQKASLVVEVEIHAPVHIVQEVFQDFPSYIEWSTWSIESADPTKEVNHLIHNDKLKVKIQNFKFTSTLLKNEPDVFEWNGGFGPLLQGAHEFSWRPSTKINGGTTFTQRESWHGWLVFLWQPGRIMGKKSYATFNGFNIEIKREAERRAAASG